MKPQTLRPTLLLIPGHWLGAWAWEETLAALTARGFPTHAITLPGLDPADEARLTRSLREQASAVLEAAARAESPAIVVAHSGANGPVSLALDQAPELFARVIWVDSGPATPGSAFAADLPAGLDELPLPLFDQLGAQASVAGLSEHQLDRFRREALSQPATALREPVQLQNDARYAIPTTLLCCSMPSSQVKTLVEAGHPAFAEVGRLLDVRYVDLPTGHWPMWSRPVDLAQVLVGEATGHGRESGGDASPASCSSLARTSACSSALR